MVAKTRIDTSEIMEKIDAAVARLERIDGMRVTADLKNNEQTAMVSRELQAVAHYLDFARILVQDEYHLYRAAVSRERRRGNDD